MVEYLIYCVLFLYIFCRVTCGWCYSKVNLSGKTAIVTGGNSGIGYQVALTLASRGCKVIIADNEDTTKSTESIIRETKNDDVFGRHLDLGSFKSIRKFAKQINETEARLDILINNAGIGSTGLKYTEDGLQKTMQVNYFGHFLLTHLLLGLLKKSSSRIIFTSSTAAFFSWLKPKDLILPKDSFSNYFNSKLCQTIAARCFAQKLKGTGVTAYSCHPGGARSRIFWKAVRDDSSLWPGVLWLTTLLFGKSTEEAAQTTLYLAMDDEVEKYTGKFFIDCHKVFYPYQVYDHRFCEEIWQESIECVKLAPNECMV